MKGLNHIKIIYPSFYLASTFEDYKDYINSYSIPLKHHHRGDLLTVPGAINNTSHYIVNGMISLSLMDENGHTKTICYFGKDTIFPIGITNHQNKMDYEMILTVISEECDVYSFSYLQLREMALNNNQFSVRLLEEDCDFIGYLLHNSITQAYASANTRISDILYMYYRAEHSDTITLSQQEISALSSTSIAQVERTLKKLRDDHIISTRRNCIKILDLSSLIKHCSINMTDE